jgi:hypothetical protein
LGKLHDIAVDDAKAEMERIGQGPCATNQKLGSRKPDLKCVFREKPAYVEVKTFKDLRTDHTRQQLADIRKEADKAGSPAVVKVVQGECYAAINEPGQNLIQDYGLKACPCPVPKSDVNDLIQCLSDSLLKLPNNTNKTA